MAPRRFCRAPLDVPDGRFGSRYPNSGFSAPIRDRALATARCADLLNRPATIRPAKSAYRMNAAKPSTGNPIENAIWPWLTVIIFSVLRTRMQWHQERQKILADNVANGHAELPPPAIS